MGFEIEMGICKSKIEIGKLKMKFATSRQKSKKKIEIASSNPDN